MCWWWGANTPGALREGRREVRRQYLAMEVDDPRSIERRKTDGSREGDSHDGTVLQRSHIRIHVDGSDGHDPRRASLVVDRRSGVEDPAQDILVVANGDNELEDELSGTGDICASGTDVGVLPRDTGVLLVDTDGVLDDDGIPRRVRRESIEV